jgi:nicotinamidase-related amidase
MQNNITDTILLVMDMQAAIIGRMQEPAAFTAKVSQAINHARKLGMPVWYVVVSFREGMPEISQQNKSFAASRERMGNMKMEAWSKIDESVAPLASDIIITKRRFSAFSGSDLEVLLRANGIQHIVLAGISSSGVVLSTVREAADKDYSITVLSNACIDFDEEVQRVLMTKIFPRQADVMTVDEWLDK